MVRHIIFGGIRSRDYGAIVDGGETYTGAERDYESVPVAGRNGELTIDNGRWKNIPIPYTMLFRDTRKMEEYRGAIMSRTGYQRLEDSKRLGEYRMARVSGIFDPQMSGVENRSGEVKITFDCMPQRFLVSGESEVTATGKISLHNPSGMPAKPMLRVFGAGKLTIGTLSLEIAPHGQPCMDIDCETGDCFWGTENMNEYVTAPEENFPKLGAGATDITLGAGIEKVVIRPKWWRL